MKIHDTIISDKKKPANEKNKKHTFLFICFLFLFGLFFIIGILLSRGLQKKGLLRFDLNNKQNEIIDLTLEMQTPRQEALEPLQPMQ